MHVAINGLTIAAFRRICEPIRHFRWFAITLARFQATSAPHSRESMTIDQCWIRESADRVERT